MSIFHLTKMLSGGGGVYTSRLSEALRWSGVESRVLSLDDRSLLPLGGLTGRINSRRDWALSGAIHRRSRGTMLSFLRRQTWNPEVEIKVEDIVHLHSITGFIGERGLQHLLRNRPRIFWTAHNPWLFTGGCVAYAGCDRFELGCRRCPLLKFPLVGWAKGELKAKVKFWRDFGVKPIANSGWMAAMMRRSPLFEGMEIPVVPPIVDQIFFATTDDADGHGWEKHRVAPGKPGLALSSQNLFTSELARDSEKISLIRSANNPDSSAFTSNSLLATAPLAPTPATSYSLTVTAPQAQALDAVPSTLDFAATLALDTNRSTLDSPMPRWAGGNRFVVGLSARSLTDGGKGIEEFFQRLPQDRAFLKETTFVLIGEGKIQVPAGLDCRFPGHVDSPERLAEMYRSLDLFVSASAMETFGMAILEAQACGTPVVAFETGGTPEAVCPAVSKLVRNGDWVGLIREVEKMFESAVKGSGKNHELSGWIARRHSWQAIAEKQIGIYGNLYSCLLAKNYKFPCF